MAEIADVITHAPVPACEICETAVIRNAGKRPYDIDALRTIEAVKLRVDSGQMRYVRADAPLEDMVALAESELTYTINSYLECRQCRRTWFWGLCIRGAPVYKPVEADAPAKHLWQVVPARERWAR